MNAQQAYLEGFVKRAGEYGLTEQEAVELLKRAGAVDERNDRMQPTPARGPIRPLKYSPTSNSSVGFNAKEHPQLRLPIVEPEIKESPNIADMNDVAGYTPGARSVTTPLPPAFTAMPSRQSMLTYGR